MDSGIDDTPIAPPRALFHRMNIDAQTVLRAGATPALALAGALVALAAGAPRRQAPALTL